MVTRKHITVLSNSVIILLAQVLLAVTVIAKPAQAQTPVGYWKFDEGSGTRAVDSSGDGHTATLVNGVGWVTGKVGNAVSANAGHRQYVSIPAIDLSDTQAVTVAFWVNRNYTTDGGSVLLEASSNYQESTTGFALLPDDETCHGIRAALRGNEGTTANCYSQPSSGVWHHVAVVYDKSQTGGDQVSLYIDGALQSPNWNVSSATNTNNFGNDPIYLFSRGGDSRFSSGRMNDFHIYNSALTAAQIQQIYDGSAMPAPSAAISYVQGNYATPQAPQTTVNVTFSSAQTAGHLNVVAVGWNDSTATVTRVADSKGNTYTRAVGPTVQNGYGSQSIYYAKNIVSAAAGTNTVTVTFSTGAVSPDIRILEYSGADTNNPVDVVAAASGNSSSCNSGSATTTNATDLIFGANLVQTITTGPGSGFTSRLLTQPDGDIAEDKMVTATGRYSATAPVSPSGPWIMQMVAFRTPGGFTISASPASLSVAQGNQGTSTISTAISGGFNSAISLSASGMPSGTTVTFNPTSIPAPGSGSSTMTITVGSATPAGTYPITVTGSGGGTQQTTTVTLTVAAPNFTFSASPTSLSVAQGNQGTATISTAVSGGFNSSISLSASGMPSGTTVTFNPTTIPAPGSGNSTMTIAVGSATPTGTYPITVKASGGGIQQSTTVTLTVTAPTFTISASPASLSVSQGNQGTSTITTAASGGFNSSITLSASGMPSGTTVTFNPTTIPAPGSGNSTMTIVVGTNTALGTYPITVKGSGGGIQQSTTVTLTVTGPATFTISASPASLSISQGNQGTSTITTAASGGFNSSITLSASGTPTGTTVTFNPATIPAPGSGTSTMTITVGSATPTGTYPITVTGNGGGVQQNAVVTLTVTASSATITYVQGNYATPQSPQSTVSVTFTAAQVAGDLNVIAVGWNDSTATVSSVRDTKGNVYSLAVGPTVQSGYASQSIYYAKNVAAAAAGANTVTVTFASAAVSPDIRILEYSGADPNNPVDVTAASSGNSASSSSGSATTTSPRDLIFGANLVQTLTSGPGSGFTQRLLTTPDGDIAEDEMVTSTGSYSATAPVSPSGAWIMQMVAFRTPAVGSFTIAASPASLSIAQGNQGTSTVTTTISGGFNSAIALSAAGVPSGTTVTFNPTSVPAPGSGSSSMTIAVGAATPAGTYPITVTGNGGGTQQTTTVTLTVTAGTTFSISASPAALSIMQGNQGASTITTAISGGFNSAITLSASGMPSGTTVTFNPTSIPAPGSGNSTMTISVGSTTLMGTYPITVTGTGGGIHQAVAVTLTVTAQVSLSWNPSSSPGIAGYNIYRSTVSGGPYTKVNSSLDPNVTYNDQAVQDGYTYYYVTTAVDNQGNESSYSNQASAYVP